MIQEQECLLGPWGHLRLEAAYLGSPTTLALVPLLPRGPPFRPHWSPLHWVLSLLSPSRTKLPAPLVLMVLQSSCFLGGRWELTHWGGSVEPLVSWEASPSGDLLG